MTSTAVIVEDLRQRFLDPHGQVLLDLQIDSFELPMASQCAVSGASGIGKTTFLNLLAGLLPVKRGRLAIAGEELSGVGEAARDRIRGRHIGLVFQRFHLLTGFSALENVVIAQNCAGAHDPAFAVELLERLGLTSRRDQPPARLSAGQQQRLAVARALANRPRLVLADEPTGNLDPQAATAAIQTLRDVCQQQQAALMIITHDPGIAATFDRRFHLEQQDGVARLTSWDSVTQARQEST